MPSELKRHVDAFLRPLDPKESLARIATEITRAAAKDAASREAFDAVARWRDVQVAQLLRDKRLAEDEDRTATLLLGAAYLNAVDALRSSGFSGAQRVSEDPTAMLQSAAKLLERVDGEFVTTLVHELRDRAEGDSELSRALTSAHDDFVSTARRFGEDDVKVDGGDEGGEPRTAAMTGPGGQPYTPCREHLPVEQCILIVVVIVIIVVVTK
jgi:hypothetical protein